ncbi:MAG: restriction endonuclease subunit S [Verrucomicrobiota bacterium]
MKKGWERKQLGELAELRGRIGWRGLTAKEYTKSGPFFLSVHSLNYGDYVDWRDAFHISEERYTESPEIMLQKDDVLICKDGAGIGKLGIVGELPDRTTINSSLLLIRSGKHILPKFLYHCLTSPYFQDIVQSRLNGATTPHLYQRDITEFPVVVPPLAEQQRIVGVLDEAFAGLATAQAHAEKNRQNARALFESHLQSVFTHRGKAWVEKPFEDCIEDVTYTTKIQRKEFLEDGKYPIVSQEAEFTNGYWNKAADVFKVTRPVVIFGDHTQVLKYVDFDFVLGADGVKLLPPKPFLIPKFFFYHLRSAPLKSLGYARHYRLLKELQISYPDLNAQAKIVAKLDALANETQRLESLYQQKLAALAALKKSLLHQAFTGEL